MFRKTSIKVFVFLLFLGAFGLLSSNVSAQEVKKSYYKELNVDFYINEDSTVDIEEEMVINYHGTFRGTFRSITLTDDATFERCKSNPALQCGGFDFMYLKEVIGPSGEVLDEDDYEVNLLDTGYEDRVEVRYEHSPGGRYFNKEDFTWKVKYKVFGSIGYFSDYDLFYWDTAFADRTDSIQSMTIRLHFPQNFDFNSERDLIVFNDSHYTFENGLLTLTVDDPLPAYDPNTVLVKFPKGIVDKPGELTIDPKINSLLPYFFVPEFKLIIDGKKIYNQGNTYKGLPTGEYILGFEAAGYNSVEKQVSFESGEKKTIEVETSPDTFSLFLYSLVILCNICGVAFIPLGIIIPIYRWYTKGRDPRGRGTIIPVYHPPEDMSSAMLGSLKDEKVDLADISSTIIDVAFQGYIKIKELDKKGKDFEFTKLKSFDSLNSEQKKIMEDIFSLGAGDSVKTSKLKNTFYTKIKGIEDVVYDEMVKRGYFSKRPDKVRNGNAALGGVTLFLVIAVTAGIIFFTGGLGFIVLLCPLIAGFIFAVFTLIFSGRMPAKTSRGVKAFEEILGFKMYMETAEKYRVQNLTPETFEKFLSFAIVFGIEKKWAEKFKGIYTTPPDWYESHSSRDIWTPIYLADSLSRLNRVSATNLASKPSSSSSSSGWSGGGWSGGGGFSGGFSGGGGGGGGGGSW